MAWLFLLCCDGYGLVEGVSVGLQFLRRFRLGDAGDEEFCLLADVAGNVVQGAAFDNRQGQFDFDEEGLLGDLYSAVLGDEGGYFGFAFALLGVDGEYLTEFAVVVFRHADCATIALA